MKLGIVARSDNTGLGYQSWALCRMLEPHRVLLVDSSDFKGVEQHPERYAGFDVVHSPGIPGFREYEQFLNGLDAVLTAETPYIYEAWNWCRMAGIKTYCQPNWELFDGLVQPNMPHPDQYLMPSTWHLEDFKELFPNTIYLPPPTIAEDYAKVRAGNLERKRRLVHVVGANAIYDRNGWAGLMDALPLVKSDFELVVFSQQDMTGFADPRVKYNVRDIKDNTELYRDFDALILPRRYGGLCLPMNEALLAGLPVIMPDISPNEILPKNWRLPAYHSGSFEGRSRIDIYSVEPQILAAKIDEICNLTDKQLLNWKIKAYRLGIEKFSDVRLKQKYLDLLSA